MGDSETPRQESQEGEVHASPPKELKKGGAFSGIKRQLAAKDFRNPAVGKMLLEERDSLLQQNAVLEVYRENYYKADKRAEVCEALNQGNSKLYKIYSLAQTLGGIVFGVAFSLEMGSVIFFVVLVVGLVLIIGSILLSKEDKQ